MNLVEIDPVRAQALQASLRGGHNVATRRAFHGLRFVHTATKFCRQHDAFAILAQDLPEDAFRTATISVDVGGIEERDAHLERFVNDFAGGLQVDAKAEIIAAQPNDRDFRARLTEFPQLHRKYSRAYHNGSSPDRSTQPNSDGQVPGTFVSYIRQLYSND